MNTILFCFVALVAVAESAKLVVVRREANSNLDGERTVRGIVQGVMGTGAGNNFKPTTGENIPTAKGVTRTRMTQTFHDLEVIGAMAEIEVDNDGNPTGQAYGVVATGIENDIPNVDDCKQNIEDMINQAIETEGFSIDDAHIDKKDGGRYVYINADTEIASLIYRVEFFYAGDHDVSFPAYYIDACNGRVMFSFNQVQNATMPRDDDTGYFKRQVTDQCETDGTTRRPATNSPPTACNPSVNGVGGNQKTGRTTYNVPGKCLNVQKSGNTCTMQNSYARVIDNDNSRTRSKNTVIQFNCENGFADPINGAFGVANDALYFGDITGRLYVEKYNVRALPYAPRLVVHYDSCYDNAFWDGTDMYFGDGCRYFYPLVNQDVVTHELGHGITSRNSNLEYRRQSGGMNEAFSDISGEVAEVFGRGSNDWLTGFELFKNPNSALRYFINPADDGRSIKNVNDYNDNMDVHYSSGIFNHAFYQLVAIQGMDIYDAYNCFLSANLGIWRSTTGFKEGACGVMQACYDNGIDHNKVKAAFAPVGIDLTSCQFDALTTLVHAGTDRSNIQVSSSHNPIFKVDLGEIMSGKIKASATNGQQITITVASDSGASNVITSGQGSVDVQADDTHVFVKLSAESDVDLTVTMTVS